MNICYMFCNTSLPRGVTRFARRRQDLCAIELLRARIGEWNDNLNDGYHLGYVTLPLTDVEPDMDLDVFSRCSDCHPFSAHKLTDKIHQLGRCLHQAI